MDFKHIIELQTNFSFKTFGPGKRTKGICSHIKKELQEIEAEPNDLEEWIDIIILGIEGAWRSCATNGDTDSFSKIAGEVHDMLLYKISKNKKRHWPNWKDFSEDEVIEHIK